MTDIVITDITTGIVDGTGIFDKLMASVKAHIHDEYDNGKIKGPEYSQVYLGAIQAVLAQSVQYALQEKQTEAQVDMILAQTSELLLNGIADRELKDTQIIGATIDNEIKQAQNIQDLAIKRTQQVKLDKETAMLGMDTVMKTANTTPDSVYTPKYGGI